MNICHITPSYYPATLFGGPIHSVHTLNKSLSELEDVYIEVLTLDSLSPFTCDRINKNDMIKSTESYKINYYRRSFIRDFSFQIVSSMNKKIAKSDIVHITSMYSLTSLSALFLSRFHNKPVILSPRGALQIWSGSRRIFVKKIWNFICKFLISRMNFVFHVTSEDEKIDVKNVFTKTNVVTIPNGVTIPCIRQGVSRSKAKPKKLMFIGRLHPKKGLENLIHALKFLPLCYTLDIYGQGSPCYETELKLLVYSLGLNQRVAFHGHVDCEDKDRAFLNADICIFPSHTENFGIVVSEALAYGIPVIVSKGMPWSDVMKYNCGLWVDNTPESLSTAVQQITRFDLDEMGRNGREWMKQEYSWDQIALKMHAVYLSMLK